MPLRLPVPSFCENSIYDITPRMLKEEGIGFLIMDLDNTLSPYDLNAPTDELTAWVDALRSAGIDMFILSNNRGNRPEIFSAALGVDYAGRAGKPFTRVLRSVIAQRGHALSETALIGDQVYTDVLCAAGGGIRSILVKPINMKNPLLALRYCLEAPFRAIYKKRNRHE